MIKRNKIFIIFMIISFIFAYLEGGNLPYVVFYVFFIIFLSGLIGIRINVKNFKFEIVTNRKVYVAGESDDFSIVITNNGAFPMTCIVVKSLALAKLNGNYNGDAISLGHFNDNKWIKSNIKFINRGIYDLGDVSVEFNDLFFVFKRCKAFKFETLTKVYPRIYDLTRLDSNGMDVFKTSVSRKSGIEDVYSIMEVRKYREGDNLKKVHWRVSAKYGELFVRNFDMVSGDECNIFFDMSDENYEYDKTGALEEYMVDFCVSVLNCLMIRGIECKVFLNNSLHSEFVVQRQEDFNYLMEFFVTQKSDGIQNFASFIKSNLNKVPKLSWVGIITTKISNKLTENVIGMKDYGYNITIYYSVYNDEQAYNLRLLRKIGIECIKCCEILNKTGE